MTPEQPEFVPVTAADVADDSPQMLHNWLRALQTEMRGGFELLGNKILPTLERIEGAVVDIKLRVTDLEKAQLRTDEHQARTDKRLDALERRSRPAARKKK